MSEKEKEILETFKDTLPKMNDNELDKLLAFSQGVAMMKNKNKQAGKSLA